MDTLPFGNPTYSVYLLIFAVAAAGCLAGAWKAHRQVSLPGVRRGLIGLLLTSGLWALCHVGVLLSPGLSLKTALYEAGLTLGFGTVWAWLWLCSAYSGRALHRRAGVRWAALAVFVAVTLTKMTNPWHGLYFTAGWGPEPFRHLAVDHHVVYWLTTALSYAMAAVGFFMLAEPLRRAQVGGGALAGLFGLTALPLGANAIGYATPYLLGLSHEPVGVAAFALGALVLKGNPSGGSRKGSRLEETSRAGREERPSLVLSEGGRVRNYNRAAEELFPALRGETSRGEPPQGGTLQEKTLQEGEIAGRHLKEALPRLARALDGEAMDGEAMDGEALGRAAPGGEALGSAPARPLEEGVLEVTGAEGQARYFRPVETTFGWGAGRLVVLTDVTERELRRRERASRLGTVSAYMPGVTFEFRAGPGGERSVEFLSEKAGAFLGFSPEAGGLYERFVEHIPEGHREAFRESVEEAAESRSGWKHEFPFERPGEERMWFLGSAEPQISEADEGDGLLFRGLLLEVTHREEAKRRREQVIRRVTDGIIEVGPEWQLTLVNGQAEEVCGMSEGEMLGRSLWEVFEDLEGTRFEEAHREAMRSREPANVEGYYSGLEEWLDVQVYPNEDGGLAFYFEVVTERKEREEALREAKSRYQTLIESFPDGGAYLFDEDLRYVLAGGEKVDVLDDPEEIVGATVYDILPKEIAERQARYFRRALEGERDEFEEVYEGRRYRIRTLPVRDEDGTVISGIAFSQDITERRRRKEALERKNDLFKRAQEIASVGAWEHDVASGELRWTDQVHRIYGHKGPTGSASPVENAIEAYHPDDRSTIQDALAGAIEEGIPYDIEVRLITEDGKERWVRTRGEPQRKDGTPEGEVARVRGTIQDITERKEREEALRKRQEKLESLYEATNHLLQAEGPEDLSARLSSLVRQALDYPATTIRLARGDKLVPAHVPDVVQARMPERPSYDVDGDTPAARAHRSGETQAFDDLSAAADTMDRGDIRATAYVPMGRYGLISVGSFEAGGIGTFDLCLLEVLAGYAALVLERLEREEELLTAKEQAEEAQRMQSSFLANMSHEIRTPLTSIIGFAEALGSESAALELPDESPLPKYAALIEKGGKRLLQTLEGVLNLSKLEAGQMELSASPVALADQACRATEELRADAQEKNIGVRREVDEVRARADKGGVQIVLRNLLSNAIKYTGEGGTIWVRTSREDGAAVLEVEDTGIGMEPSVAQELFDPFRQASEGLNRKYEGSGVGLAVTREAVEQMGGAIGVETEKGEGSRFTVRLPLARQAEMA